MMKLNEDYIIDYVAYNLYEPLLAKYGLGKFTHSLRILRQIFRHADFLNDSLHD